MQFPFDCEELFNLDPEGFVILRGRELARYAGFNSYSGNVKFRQGEKIIDSSSNLTPMDKVCLIIDKMGVQSSVVTKF